MGFPGGSVVKNLPANAGDAGLIPGSGRSLEKGMGTHSSNLAWEISWTEETGGLLSMTTEWLTLLGGFPGGADGEEPTCQCRRLKRHRFDP